MGYELRIFICEGRKEDFIGYVHPIAMVDLCKPGDSETYLYHEDSIPKKPNAYIIRDEKEVYQDCYGANLSIMDGRVLLAALDRDVDAMGYRRFEIAAATLATILKTFGNDVTVIGYGY